MSKPQRLTNDNKRGEFKYHHHLIVKWFRLDLMNVLLQTLNLDNPKDPQTIPYPIPVDDVDGLYLIPERQVQRPEAEEIWTKELIQNH